ncbi:MAG: J domain-containing protein [Spirochaetaceae bacterium]|nr:J domain-containing protein [Spirochaetaceae bacterium]
MGIFSRIEKAIFDYLDGNTAADGREDDDYREAYEELETFLRGGAQGGREEPPRIPDALRPDFALLGVEAGAPLAKCKRAYRALAKAVHPDSSGAACAEQFMRVKDAYSRIESWYSKTTG